MVHKSVRSRGAILVAVTCAVAVGVGVTPPATAAEPTPRDSSGLAKTDAGPDGIAVDAFGNVYTANSPADTVTKITPAGKATTLGTTGDTTRGIAVDESGNVYTSNLKANTVTKITPAGDKAPTTAAEVWNRQFTKA